MAVMALDKPKTRKIRRKITPDDLQAIAGLLAKRLTETDAVSALGIDPKNWFIWKCRERNKAAFASVLSRSRGILLKNSFDFIEKAQKKDWRAAKAMIELVDPATYSGQGNSGQSITIQAQSSTLVIALDRIYGGQGEKARVLPEQASTAPVVEVQAQALPSTEPEQGKDSPDSNPS